MKIYVASSWKNQIYPEVVKALREAGHEVYDFRNPAPDNHGFAWSEIDRGYGFDKAGLDWADACVLVNPCGKSARLEAGYSIGQGKPTCILVSMTNDMGFEPELMYRLAHARVVGISNVVMWADLVGRRM